MCGVRSNLSLGWLVGCFRGALFFPTPLFANCCRFVTLGASWHTIVSVYFLVIITAYNTVIFREKDC